MNRIEYEVKINENGRPYISLNDDYEQKPEDRFLAFEFTRYILNDILNHKNSGITDDSLDVISIANNLLTQISDEVAMILYDNMKSMGDIAMMLDAKYHVLVDTINERDLLDVKNIYYNNKIFSRCVGLKVLVADVDMKIYQLIDGIDNDNWVELI